MPAPASVDAYVATVPDAARATFDALRAAVLATLPGGTERISYQMPAASAEGRIVVWYAAFRDHVSLFPANDTVRDALGEAVAPYLSGRGTIRFRLDEPLPEDLVRRIVEVRLAENREAATARRASRAGRPGEGTPRSR